MTEAIKGSSPCPITNLQFGFSLGFMAMPTDGGSKGSLKFLKTKMLCVLSVL